MSRWPAAPRANASVVVSGDHAGWVSAGPVVTARSTRPSRYWVQICWIPPGRKRVNASRRPPGEAAGKSVQPPVFRSLVPVPFAFLV